MKHNRSNMFKNRNWRDKTNLEGIHKQLQVRQTGSGLPKHISPSRFSAHLLKVDIHPE